MLQAVVLFLLAMLLLGVVGKWRRPGGRQVRRRDTGTAVQAAEKCRVCGAYTIGSNSDPCSRDDCPRR